VGLIYIAAVYRFPELALFQYKALVCSIDQVHSLCLIYISVTRAIVVGSSFLLFVQLSCHLLRTLLTSVCSILNAGVNQRLEYRDSLASSICFSTVVIVASIKSFTICSSWVTDPISGSWPIVVYIIFVSSTLSDSFQSIRFFGSSDTRGPGDCLGVSLLLLLRC
jgi:hypothetical protein